MRLNTKLCPAPKARKGLLEKGPQSGVLFTEREIMSKIEERLRTTRLILHWIMAYSLIAVAVGLALMGHENKLVVGMAALAAVKAMFVSGDRK